MNYKAFPKSSDTPSRKLRKSQRNIVFISNRKMRHKLKKEQRTAR